MASKIRVCRDEEGLAMAEMSENTEIGRAHV